MYYYTDGTLTRPGPYSCGYTTTNNESSGIVHEYCFLTTSTSLTWSQAQGACVSVNYTMLVSPTSQEMLDNLSSIDNNYLYVDTDAPCNYIQKAVFH